MIIDLLRNVLLPLLIELRHAGLAIVKCDRVVIYGFFKFDQAATTWFSKRLISLAALLQPSKECVTGGWLRIRMFQRDNFLLLRSPAAIWLPIAAVDGGDSEAGSAEGGRLAARAAVGGAGYAE